MGWTRDTEFLKNLPSPYNWLIVVCIPFCIKQNRTRKASGSAGRTTDTGERGCGCRLASRWATTTGARRSRRAWTNTACSSSAGRTGATCQWATSGPTSTATTRWTSSASTTPTRFTTSSRPGATTITGFDAPGVAKMFTASVEIELIMSLTQIQEFTGLHEAWFRDYI